MKLGHVDKQSVGQYRTHHHARKATEPVKSLQLTLQLQTLPSARSLVHQTVEVIPQQTLAL